MSPLAYRWNVAGERLAPEVDESGGAFAPGPVSMRASRPRLSTDVLVYYPEREVLNVNEQFRPLAIAPHMAPEPIARSAFAAEFGGPGRVARNPGGAWSFFDGYPEGLGWQEDRFFGDGHHEFYPGIEPTEGDTFLHDYADQRRNVPYDRPQSFGEQISVDQEGALYQSLGGQGGY